MTRMVILLFLFPLLAFGDIYPDVRRGESRAENHMVRVEHLGGYTSFEFCKLGSDHCEPIGVFTETYLQKREQALREVASSARTGSVLFLLMGGISMALPMGVTRATLLYRANTLQDKYLYQELNWLNFRRDPQDLSYETNTIYRFREFLQDAVDPHWDMAGKENPHVEAPDWVYEELGWE